LFASRQIGRSRGKSPRQPLFGRELGNLSPLERRANESDVRSLGRAERDVFGDRSPEELRLLPEAGEDARQLLDADLADVGAIDRHAALGGIIETKEHPKQRGLPRARWTAEPDDAVRRYVEGD